MENEPAIRPPDKKPRKGLAFLLAGFGLFLLVGGLDAFGSRSSFVLGCILTVGAVGLVVFAARVGRRG